MEAALPVEDSGLMHYWAIVGKYLRYSDKVEITGQYRVAQRIGSLTFLYRLLLAVTRRQAIAGYRWIPVLGITGQIMQGGIITLHPPGW